MAETVLGKALETTALEKMLEGALEANGRVPRHTAEGLRRYVAERLQPGDFLTAVLSNDLAEAVARADSENAAALADIVRVLWNGLPAAAWGSRRKVNAWLKEETAPY